MADAERPQSNYSPRELECLGYYKGKEVYMELGGKEPLLPERREIILRGKIVDVREFNVDQKTIIIEIPLIHVATISETPIVPEKED